MKDFFQAFMALFFNSRPHPADEAQTNPAGAGTERPLGPTVLVIDDDIDLLRALRPLLVDAGFTVLTSTTGAKGLDMMRYTKGEVRVVILDYQMPHLNGAEVLEHLRKLFPQLKVIGLTGVALNEIPPGFRDGVDVFMTKPATAADIIQNVRQLLG